MKDFPFWRGAIHNAKTVLILKSIGEDLANLKNQANLLGDENKLNEAQLETLRLEYSLKMKKLATETMPPKPPSKPGFNK